MQQRGAITFDYGNNIRTVALDSGVANAFDIPGFVPEYVRPLFCEGKGPFRWVALSGDPRDLSRTDELVLELFPHDEHLKRWITLARERVHFQGLPARICWLGQGERARFGVALNDLVAKGEISAPIVIGRDHLDTGSVASPFRETEAMQDGSDAIADWPILNALLNTASGASWVSFHHGGGVGIGNSLHAGQVIVADGTPEMRVRLERVLTNDPGHRRRAPRRRGVRDRRAHRGGAGHSSADARLTRSASTTRMLSARFQPWHVALFLGKYAWLTARRRPVLVHFEVTLRCNARCSFCDYWKTDASARASELKSYADAARFFNPMLVTFTGGEPTLRRDLEALVAGVNGAISLKYITLITHGGDAHAGSGAVALGRRGQPVQHLARLSRRATRRSARDSRARRAHFRRGARDARARHRQHPVQHGHQERQPRPDRADRAPRRGTGRRRELQRLHRCQERQPGVSHRQRELAQVDDVVRELLAFKRRRRGVITNSDYYLEQIPRYLRGEMREPCQSGIRTIHIDPAGQVKRCPDFPTDFHWRDFRKYEPVNCNACYYACRGEAQAPLRISRIRDVMA